jgi:multiple sugar transport system permease protein
MDPLGKKYIGIKNYLKLIEDELFWNSIWNTLYFSVCAVSLEVVLGLSLALLLNRKKTRNREIYRTLMMLPIIMTPIAVAYMWRVIFTPDLGILNYILSLFGIQGPEWLADMYWAMPALIIVDVWQWVPFMALIILSGLMSLPQEPFDAAKIDGASEWQTLWYITLPMIKQIILIALLIRIIDSFKLFDLVYAMTKGGPLRYTETFNYYIYTIAFRYLDIGYAGALSITLLLMLIILSIAFIRLGGFYERK